MSGTLNKSLIVVFTITAAIYLGLLSFIHYPLSTVIKPIPIFILILLTIQSSTSLSTKRWLITALILSIIGDVVLTLPDDWSLQAGICSFLLAHCAYITLYFKDAKFQVRRLIYSLPMLAFIIVGYLFVSPYLANMTIPVTIYLCFLAFMVLCAFHVIQHPLLIISGACVFFFSDFILAVGQFVLSEKTIANIAVMFSYYIAQLLLVLGLSQRQAFPHK